LIINLGTPIPSWPLTTGLLTIVGLLTLVTWLDRRDKQRKDDHETSGAEAPTDHDQHKVVRRAGHPTEEEHRSHREAHWHQQIQIERWALLSSVGALVTAFVGAWFLYRQTQAAWEAATEARRTTIAIQRAWIKITKVDISQSRLHLDDNNVHLDGLVLQVRNTGNSPALHGAWHVEFVPVDRAIGMDDLGAEGQIVRCEKYRHQPMLKGGNTIFPGDDYPVSASAGANMTEVYEVSQHNKKFPGWFGLSIVGCFDYTRPTPGRTTKPASFLSWREITSRREDRCPSILISKWATWRPAAF
jgi:hypothetical protein